jgi:hypothetical protein
MGPNFANPVLLANGNLQVAGTFDTHGEVIDDVVIRFVIIPEGNLAALVDPLVGTAIIRRAALTKPCGNDPACRVHHGEFSAEVPNKFGNSAGDKARAIGLSVALKRSDPPGPYNSQDPPAFETFTWCVNVEIQP